METQSFGDKVFRQYVINDEHVGVTGRQLAIRGFLVFVISPFSLFQP
jgi:hypothetical protein